MAYGQWQIPERVKSVAINAKIKDWKLGNEGKALAKIGKHGDWFTKGQVIKAYNDEIANTAKSFKNEEGVQRNAMNAKDPNRMAGTRNDFSKLRYAGKNRAGKLGRKRDKIAREFDQWTKMLTGKNAKMWNESRGKVSKEEKEKYENTLTEHDKREGNTVEGEEGGSTWKTARDAVKNDPKARTMRLREANPPTPQIMGKSLAVVPIYTSPTVIAKFCKKLLQMMHDIKRAGGGGLGKDLKQLAYNYFAKASGHQLAFTIISGTLGVTAVSVHLQKNKKTTWKVSAGRKTL